MSFSKYGELFVDFNNIDDHERCPQSVVSLGAGGPKFVGPDSGQPESPEADLASNNNYSHNYQANEGTLNWEAPEFKPKQIEYSEFSI